MSLFTNLSWPRGRKPRRARLLERLDSILNWRELESLAAPLYPKPTIGRPPYAMRLMVRVWVLQFLYGLSDESTEDQLLDCNSAALFAGIDPWRPRPPGATAIRSFRLLIDRIPNDAFRLAVSDALISAGADLRLGQIREPVLRCRP